MTGSSAGFFYEPELGEDIYFPGSITATQEKTGLAAGNYECRLVGQKTTSQGGSLQTFQGTATVQATS